MNPSNNKGSDCETEGMGLVRAYEVLSQHNRWRRWRGDDPFDPTQPLAQDPQEIGIALDVVLNYIGSQF